MNVMRWFRKNNKKLMVVIVFVVMIAFGLPTVFFRGAGRGDPSKVTVGYIADAAGERTEITLGMLNRAERDIRSLEVLELPRMAVDYGILSRVGELGGIGVFPVLAGHLMFFSQDEFSLRARDMLAQKAQVEGWAADREELEQILTQIDQLVGVDSSSAAKYYCLLSAEADRAGIRASVKQIETVLTVRKDMISQGYLQPVPLRVIRRQLSMTNDDLRGAIGNYLSILLYANVVTKPLAVSESQLKTALREKVGIGNVAGTFVNFPAELYAEEIAEPSDEQLQVHFETYKQYHPGPVTYENPHGLGYMLKDRVQVEYLRIDLGEAKKVIEAEFAQLSIKDQEQRIQEYWQANRERFLVPSTEGAEQEQPEYRYLDFDEAADEARASYLSQQGRERAEQQLTETRRKGVLALKGAVTDEDRAEQAVSYAEVAAQSGEDKLDVTYDQTPYFSAADPEGGINCDSIYRVRKGMQRRSLRDILFDCQMLRKRPVTRLDEAPVKLYEDIGPLLEFGFSPEPVAVYLVRIIGADAERESVSLDDDGRGGSASQSATDTEQSILREKAIQDWKDLQAFDLACEHARQFSQEAEADWSGALLEANRSLVSDGEPNQAEIGPLAENTLEAVREQMSGLQQYMSSQSTPYLAEQLNRLANILRRSLEVAQDNSEENRQELAIVTIESYFSCLVFKDLKVGLPSGYEYLQSKPLIVQELTGVNQELMSLLHFNPVNIEKRTKFVLRTEQGQED